GISPFVADSPGGIDGCTRATPYPRRRGAYTDRMACRRWRLLAGLLALAAMLPAISACDSSTPSTQPSSGSAQPSSGSAGPITVEVNQSRDQYGKQAIQLQFTNTTNNPLTVTAARLHSPFFEGD